MIRRTYSGPMPALTGGDERPPLPCANARHIFDALVETTRTGDYAECLLAAQNMCATHLLRDPKAARACLDGAKGEEWREIVLGKKRRPTVTTPPKSSGWKAFREDRLDALRLAVADRCTPEQAAERMSITRNALWNWCDRRGHRDLYAQLVDDEHGNQHRTTSAPCGTRKRKSRAKVAA